MSVDLVAKPPVAGGEQGGDAVVTRLSTPRAISALYEEMEHIDVPVYPEIPERRRDRGILVIEDPTEQQQQQQQQR